MPESEAEDAIVVGLKVLLRYDDTVQEMGVAGKGGNCSQQPAVTWNQGSNLILKSPTHVQPYQQRQPATTWNLINQVNQISLETRLI